MNKRFPFHGTFELTGRCNMQCNMCYVRVDQEAIRNSGKRELTAAEWIRMSEEAADAGTLTLLLTGGEVTIRPDFCEIYEAIAQMGFITTVYTNATNVNDKVMALFEKYPPHVIGVTMYGASPETYQNICGHADGYDRFVKGLRRLKTLPSQLKTRTTLVKKNVNDFDIMQEFIRDEFGPDQTLTVSSTLYHAIRGGLGNPVEERLTPREHCNLLYRYMDVFNRHMEEGIISVEEIRNSEQYKKLENLLRRHCFGEDGGYMFQNCGAGINQYYISWSGEMYACGMISQGCTNPCRDGFQCAWDSLPMQYPDTVVNKRCKTCEKQRFCNSCPAYRLAETGSWSGIPEFACESAEILKTKLDPLFQKTKISG